ncbi:helix-turn-helix domain-containing protein [Myroides sp. DW712]|uniref:helix-turn-helix domain-containing protein n=1 Tax=Myroides sp. DW712 TaxID=3389800 RepID=UPI003979E92D
MKLKPIKSEQDYEAALERLALIFDALPGTEDSDELEILGMLIEKYEKEHFPMDLPNPIEAIKFRMEQMATNKMI